MLNEDECRRLAEDLLRSWDYPQELVITGSKEFAAGWVFFYNTERFTRTREIRDALAGNAPVLVDRRDGTARTTGSTGRPVEHWIEEYLREHPVSANPRAESAASVRSQLGAEDYASIKRAGLTLHGRGWRKTFSLNEMMDAWQQFVEDVEEGYSVGIEEYWNDGSCRTWLTKAWPMLTPAVRDARQPELDALDDRFRAATEPVEQWASTDTWWRSRIPIRREGELAEDIARMLHP